MELDEFGVGDHRAGAGGDGDALAARLARIGGDGVELADAAGREHDGAGGQRRARAPRATVDRRELDALHAAVAQHEIAGGEALEHADRRRAPCTAAISAAMMARPAVSPLTCRMRFRPCAASRPS